MESRRDAAPRADSDERAEEDGRLTVERAEQAWRRQVEGEDTAATGPVAELLRIVLLVLAMLAIAFLLLQRLAQIG
jgi:hypothetical protein